MTGPYGTVRLGGETIDFSDWRVGESNKFETGESMAAEKTYNYNPCTVTFDVVPTEPEKDELVEALKEIGGEIDHCIDNGWNPSEEECDLHAAKRLRELFDITPKAQPKPEPKPKTVGQQVVDEAKEVYNACIDARTIPDDLDSIIACKIDHRLGIIDEQASKDGRAAGIRECRDTLQRFCVENFVAMQAFGPQSYYTYTAAAATALDGVK